MFITMFIRTVKIEALFKSNESWQLVYAKALSIAKYGLPLYVGHTEMIKDEIKSIFMKANRAIYRQPLPFGGGGLVPNSAVS